LRQSVDAVRKIMFQLRAMARSTRASVPSEAAEAGTLLRIDFNYNISASKFIAAVAPLAPDFAAVEGLRWKIWGLNEENSSFSGLLYFDPPDAVQAFLDSDLAATMMAHPALSDFDVTTLGIMEAESEITYAPIR
jgi:hypothetical protein